MLIGSVVQLYLNNGFTLLYSIRLRKTPESTHSLQVTAKNGAISTTTLYLLI